MAVAQVAVTPEPEAITARKPAGALLRSAARLWRTRIGLILVSEVLPNILSPLLVEANLRLTYSIGLIAGLAFLGFAPNPNGADWGTMIQENELALAVQPWGVVLPVVAIALLTIGTGLVGDGIARAAVGIDRGRGDE